MFEDDDDINEVNSEDGENTEKEESDASSAKDTDSSPSPIEGFENFDETEVEGKEDAADKEETEEPEDDPNTVTVQPVQFASFEDLDQVMGPQNQNLNILLDVKLQLSVELGKTELPIKKVLELTKGSIVTLNKAAGEPVELYANGKLIAFGEVVVIEDSFGLRITHITDPVKRLNTINGSARED